jgi:hypothetical protein
VAGGLQRGALAGYVDHARLVRSRRAAGQDAGADLDDDASGHGEKETTDFTDFTDYKKNDPQIWQI